MKDFGPLEGRHFKPSPGLRKTELRDFHKVTRLVSIVLGLEWALLRHTDEVAEIHNTLRVGTPVRLEAVRVVDA